MRWNKKLNKSDTWSYLAVWEDNSICVYTLKIIAKNDMMKKNLGVGR